jgi:hypothetical protein
MKKAESADLPRSPQYSRFGAQGVVGFVGLVLFVVGQIALTLSRSRGGESKAFEDVTTLIAIVLWALAITGVVFGVWALATRARHRGLLTRFPDSTVLDAMKSPPLDRTILQLEKSLPGLVGARMPWTFSAVVGPLGIALWQSAKAATPVLFLSWTQVRGITRTQVQRERSSAWGLDVESETSGIRFHIPLVVVGNGLFGISPLRPAQLDAILEVALAYSEDDRKHGPDS